jgi:hypothetical protein
MTGIEMKKTAAKNSDSTTGKSMREAEGNEE